MIKPSGSNFKDEFAQYVARATALIHSEQGREAYINVLRGTDPVQKVANVTILVMQRVDSVARSKNIEIQDSVRVLAAKAIVDMVIELGEAAKCFPPMDDDMKEFALSVAVQDYVNAEIKAGRMHRQKVAIAIQKDIRQLPPKIRKEMQQSMARIQTTARKYNSQKKGPDIPEESAPMEQTEEEQPTPEARPTGLLAGGM